MKFQSYKKHNVSRLSKVLKHVILTFFSALAFTSCVDDKLVESESGNGAIGGDPADALTFYINAGKGFNTRYATQSNAERYESAVSSVRIFFFEAETGKDYFLFEAPKVNNPNYELDDEGNEIYKVTISVDQITDGNGNSISSQIREQLKKAPFKVSMLVNWTSSPNDWTYANSYLNTQVPSSDYKTIHDLHYIKLNENSTIATYYSFLLKENMTSEHFTWTTQRSATEEYNVAGVTPTYENDKREKVMDWIRDFWSPMHDYNYLQGIESKPVYRKYTNLWKLWNFGGSFENTALSYTDLNATAWENEWKTRNGDEFAKKRDNGGNWLGEYGNTWITTTQTLDGLTVVPTAENTDGEKDKIIRSYNKNNYHGLIMPPVEDLSYNPTSKVYYVEEGKSKGYLKFTQATSGHLNIYYSAYAGAEKDEDRENSNIQPAKLKITRGQSQVELFTITGNSIQSKEIDLKITGDEETIYIYTDDSSQNSVIIYAIEFISDTYLYETNREGKIPSSSGIAMYGVQQYEKFNSWANGEIKDLRDTPISLIRSVAKVEVYLPKKASQIFMRSMNNSARFEPSDVATNTSDTWTQSHKGSKSEDDCEWYRIQNYTPWYAIRGTGNFASWNKWYYGTWGERLGWDDVPDENENGNYPQIFNPRVIRSDFCEFIYVGEQNGGHKYILYVPEKGVDDPNDISKASTSDPKVIHIEYRYSDSTNNLDDNNCYRIYFTNYTDDETLGPPNTVIGTIDKTGYEDYEKADNGENLKYHWPILRNHIYRFNVKENDGSNVTQVINVKITPWGYEPASDWEEYW